MYFTIKYLAPEKYVPVIAWIDGMCLYVASGPCRWTEPFLPPQPPERAGAVPSGGYTVWAAHMPINANHLDMIRLAEPHRPDLW